MGASVLISLGFSGASDPFPVQALRLDRGLDHPVGRARIVLPLAVTVPDVGAEITIGFTQGDDETDVMTGFVAHRSLGHHGTNVTVLEPTASLMGSMPSKSYGATTAGQMISDLCTTADVPTGMILPGATIPHAVLQSRATMMDHAKRLARVSGLLLVTDTGGRLSTVATTVPLPVALPTLDRAQLAREEYVSAIDVSDVRVMGAGALGTGGPGMSTLPLADPSLISAGGSDAARTRPDAIIRTLADATLAQMAAQSRSNAGASGLNITTPLLENLSPGDVVLLPDANGLPLRLARLERLGVTFTAAAGLLARYEFCDLEGGL